MNQPKENYGANVRIDVVVRNGSDRPRTIHFHEFKFEVRRNDTAYPLQRKVRGGGEVRVEPGDTHVYTWPLTERQHPRFLPEGRYEVAVEYGEGSVGTVSFSVSDSAYLTKRKQWANIRERTGSERIDAFERYFTSFSSYGDLVSREVAKLYVEELYDREESAEAYRFLTSVYTGEKDWFLQEEEARLEGTFGDEYRAIRRMAKTNTFKAVNMYEDLLSEANYEYQFQKMIELGESIISKYNDTGRLGALVAEAYYHSGKKREAIRRMEPLVPSRAKEWKKELQVGD